MRFVSLFAGVGGFDLGFERSGMTCVGQVEIDKHAQKVLEQHWPNVPKHNDVRTAKEWADEQGLIGNVDVVCGGFPCQDLSVAGKRAGLAGKRSGLFHDALSFATHVKAKTIVLENVAGLLSSNGGRDFGTVLTELANAGYSNIEWRLLDSQFFGVPQRRRRIFIVANLGAGSFRPILSEPESRTGNLTQITEQECETARNSRNSPHTFGESSFGQFKLDRVSTLKASGGALGGGSENLVVFSPRYDEGVRLHDSKTAPTVVSTYGTGGGNVPCVTYQLQGTMIGRNDNAGPGGKGFRDDSFPMYTLETVSTHVIANENIVRRLTPRECERLQGFPDDWTAINSDSQRYKQMGNAVTVNVIEWIGQQLMESNDG